MSIERSEKLLVEEKALVQQEELRPLTMQRVRWKTGRDGRKRRVLVTQLLREAKGRTFEKGLAQRLRRLNVQIVCAPMGMARQKENHTTLNRRTGRINWQVEWLTLGQEKPADEDGRRETARALSKVMDDVPLYQAYPAMLEDKARAEMARLGRPLTRSTRARARAGESQCWVDSRWNHGLDCAQDPTNGQWGVFTGGHVSEWPAEREALQKRRYKFYLAGHRTRSDRPWPVAALDSGDCLRDIVTNTRVLEFPTICVVDAKEGLPPGYVLATRDTVEPQQPSLKRKDGPPGHHGGTQQGPAKRRKQQGTGREDGEVDSEDEDGADDGDGMVKGVGLEAGEIIAEQSLGEDDEDEDEDDDDDDTSSSGSDSE